MSQHHRFRAVFIGADTLLLECAQLWLDKGHELVAVISDAARIRSWASGRGTPVLAVADHAQLNQLGSFDYLFAVTHLALLPDALLALPLKAAINFHDGPLPRYAGLNAPAWALMNRERSYGISWHEIRGGIDEGDLLKQRIFDIAEDETSLSLNTRNFAVAIECFAELVDELGLGTVQKLTQDLSQRSYFSKHQRPDALAVLDFERPAAELAAWVRALDFGDYDNPLATPKLVHGERFCIVRAAEVVEASAPATPGTVTELSEDALEIATGEHHLRISQVTLPCGTALPVIEAANMLGLAPGQRVSGLPQAAREQLNAHTPELARAEAFWVRRLSGLEPATLALARAELATTGAPVELSLPLPVQLVAADPAEFAVQLLTGFALYVARTSGKLEFDLGFRDERRRDEYAALGPLLAEQAPLHIALDETRSWAQVAQGIQAELALLAKKAPRLRDDVARFTSLRGQRRVLGRGELAQVAVILRRHREPVALPPGVLCALALGDDAHVSLVCDPGALGETERALLLDQLSTLLHAGLAAQALATPVSALPLVSDDAARALRAWNETARAVETDTTIAALFAAQVARTPDQPALVFEDRSLTFRELAEATARVAQRLRQAGVGPESLVGVHVTRSAELVVAALGVLTAGAAYVPLDPSYPQERLRFMLEDSGARVVLTDGGAEAAALAGNAELTWLDIQQIAQSGERAEPAPLPASGKQLAYVIYTSGSTGKPKGVMVEHRNVVNFFAGMDAVVQHRAGDVWLSVTSLSFDISVLELFWSLTRGLTVVVHRDRDRDATLSADVTSALVPPSAAANTAGNGCDFSLFLWGAQADASQTDGYRLMLEAGRFGDKHGFIGIWTPERHFHAFGGAYPNPAVTGAALAAVTERIQVRAGSCVSPLHHAARVAEDWAVVDQLSRGRVGLSFAAGWQPDDFVLQPANYRDNKRIMFEQIDQVRRLWRGEALPFPGPRGQDVRVQTHPRPVQAELPFWITTAGNPETFKLAGQSGANLLTHLLGQSLAEVAEKIAIYRRARAEAGHDPKTGYVSLMLHTHVGASREQVRERVREPMKAYLRSSVQLIKGFAWAFPAFKRPQGTTANPGDIDIAGLSESELDAVLEFAFERYFETSGLFGTPESCRAMVESVAAIGVDDIACLIDFGMPTEQVLEGLPYLAQLRAESQRRAQPAASGDAAQPSAADFSLAALIGRHHVTHMQATPALLRMARTADDARAAIDAVPHLFVGGEAFPANLAQELRAHRGTVTNMYGPTETTVWSATHRLQPGESSVPLGRPIANTRLYVLDAQQRPMPIGVPGELYIAGHGVVRGYLGRSELTEQRFLADPFVPGQRMYRTGDLVRWTSAGVVEFLGRTDHQVKVRGYRIELGEIEAQLLLAPGTREAVVIAREDQPGDVRLVAYVTGDVDTAALRERVRAALPAYMVPSAILHLPELPHTPNGKIARNALPAPEALESAHKQSYAPPESSLEEQVAALWCEVLGKSRVGIDDNFFDSGGHSLLVVKLHRLLKAQLSVEVPLTDLYRYPTVRSFVARWAGNGTQTQEQAQERASLRRERMTSMRGMANRRRTR